MGRSTFSFYTFVNMTYIKKEDVLEAINDIDMLDTYGSINDVYNQINALPEQPQNEVNTNMWISVSEKLPKEEWRYLVVLADWRSITSATRTTNYWFPDCYQEDVIFWQPLPNPPSLSE